MHMHVHSHINVHINTYLSLLLGQVLVRNLLVFFPSPILCVYTNRRSKFKWKHRYRRERYIKRKCCRLEIGLLEEVNSVCICSTNVQ
jgi:hypothetical protein